MQTSTTVVAAANTGTVTPAANQLQVRTWRSPDRAPIQAVLRAAKSLCLSYCMVHSSGWSIDTDCTDEEFIQLDRAYCRCRTKQS